jgi:quercetin dioxygenase-like cupin family protein
MQLTRNSVETAAGPTDWFTGSVYIDAVAAPEKGSRLSASSVHFTPGARTHWHTHPNGQTIWVTEGLGLCQRDGGPVEVIRPGDRVFFEPGERHWHGATPTRFMTHIAMQLQLSTAEAAHFAAGSLRRDRVALNAGWMAFSVP